MKASFDVIEFLLLLLLLKGWVYDVTQNYNNAFHVGGILLILGGSINFLLHLPYFQRRTYANRMLAQQKQEY